MVEERICKGKIFQVSPVCLKLTRSLYFIGLLIVCLLINCLFIVCLEMSVLSMSVRRFNIESKHITNNNLCFTVHVTVFFIVDT